MDLGPVEVDVLLVQSFLRDYPGFLVACSVQPGTEKSTKDRLLHYYNLPLADPWFRFLYSCLLRVGLGLEAVLGIRDFVPGTPVRFC